MEILPTLWTAVATRLFIATLSFATLAGLMVVDQLGQPDTTHVPQIHWTLEKPNAHT